MDPGFYHSLIEGDFGNGFALRMSLTEGDFWTRGQGCYTVHRGEGYAGSIDFKHILCAQTSGGELNLPGYVTHRPDSETFYAVRRVSGTGIGEKGTMALVRLALDEQGKVRPLRPNPVRYLRASGVKGYRIRVSWWYWPLGEQIEPAYFAIYGDNGSKVIDYENPLGQVDYNKNYFYTFETEALTPGTPYRFAVRAVSEAGNDCRGRGWVEGEVNVAAANQIIGWLVRYGR